MPEAVVMDVLVGVEVCSEQVVFQEDRKNVHDVILTGTGPIDQVGEGLGSASNQDFADWLKDILT